MGKYILLFFIGILVGNLSKKLVEKYWMDVLIGILYVAMFTIIGLWYVITLPITIINLICNLTVIESKIIREYDRIFYQVGTMEKVKNSKNDL